MAGKIRELIDQLIHLRTDGKPGLVAPLKIKMIMKGVDPDLYDASSADDNVIINRIVTIAHEMGYDLNSRS